MCSQVTLADLAKIHTKVIASVPNLQREQARWDTLLRRVAETEAIIDKVRMCSVCMFVANLSPT